METVKTTAFVRLATKTDIPVISLLIRGLAKFEKLEDECHATEAALGATLFAFPAFQGPTVLILELGCQEGESRGDAVVDGCIFQEVSEEVDQPVDFVDPEASLYVSSSERRTVVGFVLFSPNYSTFLAKPGIYVEDLYVRESYRARGFGTILLRTVAQQASRRNFGRVEWSVLDWNVNAIKFYEKMGATVMHEWRICRLAGEALQQYQC